MAAMITRKRLFILAVVLIALILGTSLASRNREESNQQTAPDFGVVVDNLDAYESKLKAMDITKEIQALVYTQLQSDRSQPVGLYKATVRDKSFSKTLLENGVPYYTFLVDIPSVKQSYKISLVGGDDYEQSILDIDCPEQNELIYPAQPCKRLQ